MIRAATLFLLIAAPAAAQVSVDTGALSSLQPSAPASHPTIPHPPAHRTERTESGHARTEHARPERVVRPERHARPEAAKAEQTTRPPAKPEPAPAKPKPVTLAPAPPPNPVLTPPPNPAPRPVAPPQTVPVAPGAPGEASPLPTGLRVTFGAGRSDFNPATVAALQALARSLKPDADINLFSYAAGSADDPSTPRRLSLSRALAVRAVLMNEGIASTRIYPRALGATPSDGPANRVDVTTGPVPAGAPPAAKPP